MAEKTSLMARFLTRRAGKDGDGEDTSASPFTPEHLERRMRFLLRWDYYLGDQAIPLQKRSDEKDTNVIESYTTVIINNSVNFLFGAGVSFEIGVKEPEAVSVDEEIVRKFWEPRVGWNPAEFLEKLGQSGSVTGTPFVRMYTNEEEILLKVYDSALVDIVTNPTNIDDVLEYHLFWRDGKNWSRHRVAKTDGGTWEIHEELYAGSGTWSPVDMTPWPYPFAPVFYCQNIPLAHSVWGISDSDHARLNDTINEMSTDINKILHYHAAPVTVAYGVSGTQLRGMKVEMGAGRIIPAPPYSADGKLPRFENLEMQTNLSASAAYKNDVVDAYNDIAGNVKVGREEVSLGALSGFAIKLLYLPLLQKTKRKQQTYGAMLSQINHAILSLRGITEPPYVQTLFGDPLPRNLPEMVDSADKLAAKSGLEGSLTVAGFTPDEVALLTGNIEPVVPQ